MKAYHLNELLSPSHRFPCRVAECPRQLKRVVPSVKWFFNMLDRIWHRPALPTSFWPRPPLLWLLQLSGDQCYLGMSNPSGPLATRFQPHPVRDRILGFYYYFN